MACEADGIKYLAGVVSTGTDCKVVHDGSDTYLQNTFARVAIVRDWIENIMS